MAENADSVSDLELALKFSPILVLTEETGGEWVFPILGVVY